ncbi:MAG: DUF2442 domain-containing protein [Verrucomicrobiota bacterium]
METLQRAYYADGKIHLLMASGSDFHFPTQGNPRLENASEEDLNTIEISPFGLHWPRLDEDLSLRGIAQGDYGQRR